jgi:hypothetical protein
MDERLFNQSISGNLGTVLAILVDERADEVGGSIYCILDSSHLAWPCREAVCYIMVAPVGMEAAVVPNL